MISQIVHLTYSNFKLFCEQNGHPYLRLRFALECLAFAYTLTRTATISYQLWYRNTYHSNLWHFDYAVTFLATQNPHIYNEFFVLQFVLMAICNLACQEGFYRSGAPHYQALRKFHLYIVLNTELFEQCYRKQDVSQINERYYQGTMQSYTSKYRTAVHFLPRPFALLAKVQTAVMTRVQLKHYDFDQLRRQRLPDYFDIPFPLRIQMYWAVKVYDWASCQFQCFVVFLFLATFLLALNYFISTSSSFYLFPLLLSDFFCLFYQFLTLIQTGFTYTFCSILASIIFKYKIPYAIRQIKTQMAGRRMIPTPTQLHYFLEEHRRIVVDIIRPNEEVWSGIFFWFLLTNVPTNAYLTSRIVYVTLNQTELLIMLTIVLGQGISTVFNLLPCGDYSKSIHNPAKHLVAIQQHIGVSPKLLLLYKLKIDDLFSRLTRGPKYGITAGPFGTVTHHNIAEGILMYIAFLLFVFGLDI